MTTRRRWVIVIMSVIVGSVIGVLVGRAVAAEPLPAMAVYVTVEVDEKTVVQFCNEITEGQNAETLRANTEAYVRSLYPGKHVVSIIDRR